MVFKDIAVPFSLLLVFPLRKCRRKLVLHKVPEKYSVGMLSPLPR